MKGDLIKVGVAVATAIIIIAVVAALVSGYMSAFKPGNNNNNSTSTTTGYAGGAGGGGMTTLAGAITPTPSPAGAMPGPEEMSQTPPQPVPDASLQVPSQQALTENQYTYNAMQPMSSRQAQPGGIPGASPGTSTGPEYAGTSPPGMPGGQGRQPWFNIAPSVNTTISPSQPPVTSQPPVMAPPQVTTPPIIRPPATTPETPEIPAIGLTPYEYGWRLVIQRLLEAMPLMFPGYYPGHQWFIVPSAY